MILYGAASGQPDPLDPGSAASAGSLYVQRPTLADLHPHAGPAARARAGAVRADRGRQAQGADRRPLSARAGPAGPRGPRGAQDDRKAPADPVKELQGRASAALDVAARGLLRAAGRGRGLPGLVRRGQRGGDARGRAQRRRPGLARAQLHVPQSPFGQDFELFVAVRTEPPGDVTLTRVPDGPSRPGPARADLARARCRLDAARARVRRRRIVRAGVPPGGRRRARRSPTRRSTPRGRRSAR